MLKSGKHALAAAVLAVGLIAPAAQAMNATTSYDWWPEQLDLQPLRQHAAESNPMGTEFNYAEAFSKLDLNALKADIRTTLTTEQPWWPADYGHYGPFFVRMAWHTAFSTGAVAPAVVSNGSSH